MSTAHGVKVASNPSTDPSVIHERTENSRANGRSPAFLVIPIGYRQLVVEALIVEERQIQRRRLAEKLALDMKPQLRHEEPGE